MKLAALIFAVLLALAAVVTCIGIGWNVWYAESHTPTAAPGTVEQGKLNLHAQLEQTQQREAEIEKLFWNQPEKLEVLIASHKQRLDKLTGNPSAGELAAHDQQAVTRLEQRIVQIAAERQAQAEAAAAAQAAAEEQAKTDAAQQTTDGRQPAQ